jgi:hypothetical protein
VGHPSAFLPKIAGINLSCIQIGSLDLVMESALTKKKTGCVYFQLSIWRDCDPVFQISPLRRANHGRCRKNYYPPPFPYPETEIGPFICGNPKWNLDQIIDGRNLRATTSIISWIIENRQMSFQDDGEGHL